MNCFINKYRRTAFSLLTFIGIGISYNSFSQTETCISADDVENTAAAPGNAFHTEGNIDLIQAPNIIENSYWKMYLINTTGWLDIGTERETCTNKELSILFSSTGFLAIDGDTFNLNDPIPSFVDKKYSFNVKDTLDMMIGRGHEITVLGDFKLISVKGNSGDANNGGALASVCLKTNNCSPNSAERNTKSEIKLYPNPTFAQINLDIEEKSILTIYSIEGKLLASFGINKGENLIDLSNFGKGNFILEATSKNERKTAIATVK